VKIKRPFSLRIAPEVIEHITEGPIVITRNGKPAAVLIAPVDDEDLEDLILVRSPHFQVEANEISVHGPHSFRIFLNTGNFPRSWQLAFFLYSSSHHF